jgi:hypothetical protein
VSASSCKNCKRFLKPGQEENRKYFDCTIAGVWQQNSISYILWLTIPVLGDPETKIINIFKIASQLLQSSGMNYVKGNGFAFFSRWSNEVLHLRESYRWKLNYLKLFKWAYFCTINDVQFSGPQRPSFNLIRQAKLCRHLTPRRLIEDREDSNPAAAVASCSDPHLKRAGGHEAQ